MSIYDMMNNKNEITLKIKIESKDINNIVYFLGNTQENDDYYYENDKKCHT